MQGDSQSHNFIFRYLLEIYAYLIAQWHLMKKKTQEKMNKFQLASVCIR